MYEAESAYLIDSCNTALDQFNGGNRGMALLTKELSNPFSTGNGGGNFETRVQSAFVVLMLTGQLSPCLPAWPITKIKLQGRYAGFNTDDFIVFTSDANTGREAKLLAQIKHTVSITEINTTFGEVIQSAWRDFNDPTVFSIGTDAFALITGPLSASEINNTRSLLEWARHCENEAEFLDKVSKEKFSNDSKRAKLEAFRSQLKVANEGIEVPDEQLWRFLKSFHLIGYDIDTESGSTISLIQSLIAQSSTENANLLWSRIVYVIQSYNQDAGTLTLGNLPQDIRDAFNAKQSPVWASDFKKLMDHSNYIIAGIRTDIGGAKIPRCDSFRQLLDKSEEADLVFLSGERGCGKSAIVREFAECMKNRAPVFCLRTEDLNAAHLDHVFSNMGLKCSLSELEACLALMPKKYLLIESLEKLLELNNTAAFIDLMQFVKKHPGWTIIASGRDYAYQQISFNYLRTTEIRFSSMVVSGLSDDDIRYLCEKHEILKPFSENQSLKPLLRTPFFADLAYRVLKLGTQLSKDDGEKQFRTAIWRDVISKEKERLDGLPVRRKRTFVEIATCRAKQMVYGVSESNFDSVALFKLEEDNLIRRDSSSGLVSLAHDVFEDWALERYIDEIYQANPINIPAILDAVGHEPAMNRAFRLWLHQKLRFGEEVTNLVIGILGSKVLARCWQDETISAILLGPNAFEFLNRLKSELTDGDGELIKRFCFILRIVCKEPDKDWSDALGTLYFKPYSEAWDAMIRFAFENRNCISQALISHVTAVLAEWSSLIHIENELPPSAREAGLLALHMLNMVKDVYRDEGDRKKLLTVIIKVIPAIIDEFNEMIDLDVFKIADTRDRLEYVDDLFEIVLTGVETSFLCKHVPDTLIRLAFHVWIVDDSKIKRDYSYGVPMSVERCFGLHQHRSGSNFFPASGLKGPFVFLLRQHPRKGIDFIVELVNRAAGKYAFSDLDLPERYSELPFQELQSGREQVEIPLNDGTIIKQYCSARLWFAYRGHSVTPYLLQSALMAMENWLIDLCNILPTNKLEELFEYILRNSNSVMLTAVLSAVATGFPQKLGHSALPILKTPEFYNLDLIRTVHERGDKSINWFNSGLQHEPLADLYSKERRKAALRPWRQASLESLIEQMQLSDMKNEAIAVIDELRTKVPSDDEKWRFRFHRIDSRGWRLVEDKVANQLVVTSAELESDLMVSQQKQIEYTAVINRFCTLSLWVEKTLDNKPSDQEYFANWQEALAEAKKLLTLIKSETGGDLAPMFYGSIVKVAAHCLQDHGAELCEDEWVWCVDLIISAVLANADTEDQVVIMDKIDHEGAAAAASILPVLLDKAKTNDEKFRVEKIIAIALTHVNEVVRTQAANGIRKHMWQRDRVFAQKCILGSVELARLKLTSQKEKSLKRQPRSSGDFDKEACPEAWLVDFREQIACADLQVDIAQISFATHSSWHLLSPCLMIPDGSIEPSHVQILSQVLTLLFEVEASHSGSDDTKIRIHHELPTNFAKRFAVYLISLSKKDSNLFIEQLRHGCDVAPAFIQYLLLCIACETEKMGNQDPYWRLWKQLSVAVQNIAIALSQNSGKRSRSDERNRLIRSMLCADMKWQKIDYENQNIAMGKDVILEFAVNAGMNANVFEALASLMFHFPNIFFEPGLCILAKHKDKIGGTQLISGNAAFYLERAIQRYLLVDNVQPLSKATHQNCWILLDGIIETASSVAYYLREHLMRSRKIANSEILE